MGFGFRLGRGAPAASVTAMLSPGTFRHRGAFGTQGWVDPRQDLILVLLSSGSAPQRRRLAMRPGIQKDRGRGLRQ